MAQIEVATHFNEDAFSLGLAQGLADKLRAGLRGVRCEEHGEEPSLRLSTQGVAQTLNDITIEVAGCCEALTARARQTVDEVWAGHDDACSP